MLAFTVSPRLRDHLSLASKDDGISSVRREMYSIALEKGEIAWDVARALSRDVSVPVDTLLRTGCSIVVPGPFRKPYEQSAEAKALFEKQRRELENKRYRNMVSNVVASQEEDKYRDRREIKSFRDQFGIGVNMMITRIVLLVAGWYIGSRVSPVLGPILGALFMVVGLFAEMGLFLIKSDSLDKTLAEREQLTKKNFPGSVPMKLGGSGTK